MKFGYLPNPEARVYIEKFKSGWSRENSDFTVHCGNRRLRVHKVILHRRSFFFKHMFDADDNVREYRIPGAAPEMVRKTLALIYGDIVNIAQEDVGEFQRIMNHLFVNHFCMYQQPEDDSETSGSVPAFGEFLTYEPEEGDDEPIDDQQEDDEELREPSPTSSTHSISSLSTAEVSSRHAGDGESESISYNNMSE